MMHHLLSLEVTFIDLGIDLSDRERASVSQV